MKINTSYLVLNTNKKIKQDSSKLRGYIGNKFDYPLLHNHYAGDKILYSYPLIQYHVIDGQASILGIEEGAELLNEIADDITELRLSDSYYKVEEKTIVEDEINVSTTNREYHYKFITPWLALNKNNFENFNNISDWKERKVFLNRILTGNILSMAKGLGIIVDRRLYPKTRLDFTSTSYKSVRMLAFTGEFRVRFRIPDYFGFGKGVSHGFGTVKRIPDEKQKESDGEKENPLNK